MCNECGGIGENLRWDPQNTHVCSCVKDGIKLVQGSEWSPSTSSHGNYPFVFHPPASPQHGDMGLNLPKQFHINKKKLAASVYAKSHSSDSVHRLSNDRFVLKYTDAGIQKPSSPIKVAPLPNSFPKLVSRYTMKRTSRDGLPVYIESYKENAKLTVVTHSFS